MFSGKFISNEDYFEVEVVNDLNLDSAREIFSQIAEYINKSAITKVLINATEITVSMPAIDNFYLAKEFSTLGISPLDKIALYASPASESDIKISETMIRNRGFNLRFFQNRKLALDWLLGD